MSDQLRTARERRLAEIIREVKVASAERDDVVVEMRDADRARLELLAQELKEIIAEVPADDDQFDFALSSGLQPRFWIDAVAHVHMGRDRRTYRFVRDTRLGRTVMSETADMGRTADAVSRYVAERIIQRQRLLEGDFEMMRAAYEAEREAPKRGMREEPRRRRAAAEAEDDIADEARPVRQAAPRPAPAETPPAAPSGIDSRSIIVGFIWFLSGCILGGLLLMATFADYFTQ